VDAASWLGGFVRAQPHAFAFFCLFLVPRNPRLNFAVALASLISSWKKSAIIRAIRVKVFFGDNRFHACALLWGEPPAVRAPPAPFGP